ncbi:MAG TPA: methylglyoxal synthase [Chitinophagaceae bacterium]|nr:methylglyoxal synthase [Chitinophagaceae bacterium]
MTEENMSIVKRIAIVAHESGKNDLIDWSFHNREILKRHEIIAAGYTGDVLEGTLNVPVCKLLTGSLGGFEQLGDLITNGKVDLIIFLGFPKKTQPIDSDMKTLLRLAEEHNLVIASNMATAEVILSSAYLGAAGFHSTIDEELGEEKKVVKLKGLRG